MLAPARILTLAPTCRHFRTYQGTMERLSIFDIYKIGVGPSSSHTLGPWKAAREFVKTLMDKPVQSIRVHLYGSLSQTGKGHATDTAVILGLQGHDPETIPIASIASEVQTVHDAKTLVLSGHAIDFNPSSNIFFEDHALPFHPNALKFEATLADDAVVEETYYSIGGGFVSRGPERETHNLEVMLPYPIDQGSDLVGYCRDLKRPIWEIVYENEKCFRTEDQISTGMQHLFDTMLECVFEGCRTDGILPGGLNVRRRAKALNLRLLDGREFNSAKPWVDAIRQTSRDFDNINKWVSCFALAVNEQNAALGRVVTSPTNGAAGVIPAVLLYYYCFCDQKGENDLLRFMLTSGEIGCIFKKKATISAAVGGCQAEIGVSSAMAAAGLTELLGGSSEQVLMAAEIAMEHHLGLTCDPIGGLVQIPCIERNTMGAIKAITSVHLALTGEPANAIVQFDTVVKTMWDTAQDMHHKYKETATGGLAMNLPVVLPNC